MSANLHEISWHSPIESANNLAYENYEFCLLYSSKKTTYSGEFSYLAWGKQDEIIGENIEQLAFFNQLKESNLPHWFGYIGYESGHNQYNIVANEQHLIKSANLHFIKYRHVIKYNHTTNRCLYDGDDVELARKIITLNHTQGAEFPAAKWIKPIYSREEYSDKIRQTIEQIYAGNFYQANLTCKFMGELTHEINLASAFAGFRQLSAISPAPYSSFIYNNGLAIISASPELFVKIDGNNITTRPIKGTSSQHESADLLKNSSKNMAENLMIVDLMRNDLASCAIAGTVEVPKLWEIDSFTNLHHLSSTITATLLNNFQLKDVLSAIFPPGSMTGAPKLASMQWLNKIEKISRGIYSGALGWINGNNCEFSVIIRTIIITENKFELQVGGGIVADSIPEDEYEEILLKAKSLFRLLKVVF